MIILCDVDGVLADFIGGAVREASEVLGREVSRKEITSWDFPEALEMTNRQAVAWDKRICRKGFCARLEMLPGAVKAMDKLYAIGRVVCVTTPWYSSKFWLYERQEWLRRHFGTQAVTFTNAKSLVKGDVIIDDNLHHVMTGERKLRVLVPTEANAAVRKLNGNTYNEPILVTKSWPKIIAAVRGVR